MSTHDSIPERFTSPRHFLSGLERDAASLAFWRSLKLDACVIAQNALERYDLYPTEAEREHFENARRAALQCADQEGEAWRRVCEACERNVLGLLREDEWNNLLALSAERRAIAAAADVLLESSPLDVQAVRALTLRRRAVAHHERLTWAARRN